MEKGFPHTVRVLRASKLVFLHDSEMVWIVVDRFHSRSVPYASSLFIRSSLVHVDVRLLLIPVMTCHFTRAPNT